MSRDAITIITYESEKASPEESESEQPVEDVTEDVGKLKIDDEKFLSPDSASTASTHSSNESTPVSANVPREKPNEFLQVSKIEPLGKPWLSWRSISDRSRQRQANKTIEIVAAVLKTIFPYNAGYLW